MGPRVEARRCRHADLESTVSIDMPRQAPDVLRKRCKPRIHDLIAIRERLQTPAL